MKKEAWLVFALYFICLIQAVCQPHLKLEVKKGLLVILNDTTYITLQDTVLLLTEEELKSIRFRENPQLKSTRFYDSLRRKASVSAFTREVVDLIVKKKKRKEKLVSAMVKSEEAFKPFEGLIIGSIVFKTVDLIEGSVIDTLQKATTKLGKFVNNTHINTRARIVNQNLLFEVGDLIDPYTLADNERILRQLNILRDVRIYVEKNKSNTGVADVIVVTQDVFSLGVSGSYSSLEKYKLDVYDVNILGYGQQLQASYFKDATASKKHGFEITLREPNLFGTFLLGALQYTNNAIRQRTRMTLGRDFLTPEIKYAGGLDVYRTRENFYFEAYDTMEMPYAENSVDVWAGRSFKVRKRTNLIFAGRTHLRKFTNAPFVSSDSNSFFHDRTLILGSVSLTKRNYLKSMRIRGFGRTEDIPVGGSAAVVFGKELNDFVDRPYIGLSASFGKYFSKVGYINASVSAGSFYKHGVGEDGLILLTGTYFTDLTRMKRLHFRQFIHISYSKGLNRRLNQTISIAGRWRDEAEKAPIGNERLTFGFETVYFMPWYTYGFQFALFHQFDLNLLVRDTALFTKETLFPSIRGGARILNESLVLPAFIIELAHYGKNTIYGSAWEFKISATIPDLFGTSQSFKPQVPPFR